MKRGTLWVFVGRGGRKFHRPTNSTSVTEALSVRDTLLKEVLAGEKQHAGTGNITCEVLLANYLDRLERTSKPESDTYAITKGTVNKHVLPFFGPQKAERINRKVLESYQTKKLEEVKQVTINRHLGYLRTAFKQGKRDKLTNNEPDFSTTIIRSAEEENVRTGIVTEVQYAKLVPALESQILVQTLFVLGWNTGVRPAEAFRLKWDQVDWEDRLIAVFKRQSKIGKARYLPLRQNAFEQLLKWYAHINDHIAHPVYIFTHPATGKRMTKNDYRLPWAEACLACGYGHTEEASGRNTIKTDLLFYDSRRAFRTYLPTEVNATDGKSVMGQTQDATFERYSDTKKAAQRVLAAMESKEPPKSQDDVLERLERYQKLKEQGALTDEEFGVLKRKLIGA